MNPLRLLEPGTRGVTAPECPYLPLLGSWDITSFWYLPDGRTREAKGEWHFAMILGGLGLRGARVARVLDGTPEAASS